MQTESKYTSIKLISTGLLPPCTLLPPERGLLSEQRVPAAAGSMTDIRRSLNSNQIADTRRASNLAFSLQFNLPKRFRPPAAKKKKKKTFQEP